MGQYYTIINPERKEYFEFFPCKAIEQYLNDSEYMGKFLMILYHDKTCIERGGGDIPFSEIEGAKKWVGRWCNSPFYFMGDYTEHTEIYEDYRNKNLNITKPLINLVDAIDAKYN